MCNEHSKTAFGLNICLLREILVNEAEFFFHLRSIVNAVCGAKCVIRVALLCSSACRPVKSVEGAQPPGPR